mgnify:CR=1 FL=1
MDIIQQVIKFESSILEAKNLYKIKLKNLNVLKSAILAQGLQSEAA